MSPVVFLVSVFVLWVSLHFGIYLRRRSRILEEGLGRDLDIVLTATLTLLGLIIGFSFSMAVSRYDLRTKDEAEEANAIGTEYVRASLLPSSDAEKIQALLAKYVSQRVLFYTEHREHLLQRVGRCTATLQADLWSAVRPAAVQSTPVSALVISGMNDVLNSQGYTEAAWWNRIPTAAWILMAVIAVSCNVLLGYASHSIDRKTWARLVLPMLVSVSFFLIVELDTPRSGFIRVHPRELERLSAVVLRSSSTSAPSKVHTQMQDCPEGE